MLTNLAYVAAVINTYRKTRLMLLEILCRMARQLNRREVLLGFEQQSSCLIEDILASIPYHLASDPQAYLTFIAAGTPPPIGRPVGGLLLLHPLYVLATCQSLSSSVKSYVLNVLAWIGEHMGIGQATMMAKVSDLSGYPRLTKCNMDILLISNLALGG